MRPRHKAAEITGIQAIEKGGEVGFNEAAA